MRNILLLVALLLVSTHASAFTVNLTTWVEGGDKPIVVGETNLPDGIKLMIRLTREESQYSAGGEAKVTDGRFRGGPFSQKDVGLNPGTYTLNIIMPIASVQPPPTWPVIGNKGANLQGPLVKEGIFGEKIIEYNTSFKVGSGQSSSEKDIAAREQSDKDRHTWWLQGCKDICDLKQSFARNRIEEFDWERCYYKCVADETVSFTNNPTSKNCRVLEEEAKPSVPDLSRELRFSEHFSADSNAYDKHIKIVSLRYGVDPHLIKAMIRAGSDFDCNFVSKQGAQGLMQLMPETARNLNVVNPFDPEENIDGGVRHFRAILDSFDGNLPLSLAAYHDGPNLIQKLQKIPEDIETIEYIKMVISYYKGYKGGKIERISMPSVIKVRELVTEDDSQPVAEEKSKPPEKTERKQVEQDRQNYTTSNSVSNTEMKNNIATSNITPATTENDTKNEEKITTKKQSSLFQKGNDGNEKRSTKISTNNKEKEKIHPKIDISIEQREHSRSAINKFISEGLILKAENPLENYAEVWVANKFYSLPYDLKTGLLGAVFIAYCNDEFGVVIIKDGYSGNEIGHFYLSSGLKMDKN